MYYLLMLPSHVFLLKAKESNYNPASFPFPCLLACSGLSFVFTGATFLSLFSGMIAVFSSPLQCDRVETAGLGNPNIWTQILAIQHAGCVALDEHLTHLNMCPHG